VNRERPEEVEPLAYDGGQEGGVAGRRLVPIAWDAGRKAVRLIDQTLLPTELKYIDIRSFDDMCEAIAMLRVRGAPAIGVGGALGIYLGLAERAPGSAARVFEALDELCPRMIGVRPTAVNLSWAVDRVRRAVERAAGDAAVAEPKAVPKTQEMPKALARPKGPEGPGSPEGSEGPESPEPRELLAAALREAVAIADEDAAACRRIGEYGAQLVPDGGRVLTHCNAGALATAGWGTALAALYVARERGKKLRVWADETRPLLQGSRLTAFELAQAGIDVTVICDNMAASLMRAGQVDIVIVGADRVAANGDVCNKIGTYGLACLANMHRIPFIVACPTSTLDLSLGAGDEIPIEQRDPREVTHGFGRQTAPDGVGVYNPAFDVTPNELVTAIVTERGIVRAPYGPGLAAIMDEARAG
jgi:methylthioribose-1-phosphate isomerase